MSDPLSAPETPVAQQRVLVIDDEPVIGLSCRRSLSPEGYDVEACEDPQVGLQSALTDGFDVILVDLMMPGMSGLEILKRVKAAGVSAEVVTLPAAIEGTPQARGVPQRGPERLSICGAESRKRARPRGGRR